MEQERRLKSIRVTDLSTVLAGPLVGSFFAELGALVVKIEHPEHPDITRSWKLPSENKDTSVSAYFSSVNYKKHYLQLNPTIERERQLILKNIALSDIVLMNYKKGLQEKIGLTDEEIRAVQPQIIIGKINGFGNESDRVAYDLILQAESGIMSMNGTPTSGPVKMPIALIDVMAAHHLKEGILLELLHKKSNPYYQGNTVTVSLYDAAVSSLANQASNYLMADYIPQRMGSLHPNIAPYGELFVTKDDKTITFAIGSNAHFSKLCSFLGLEELPQKESYRTVQNRVKNRKELFLQLKEKVKEFTAQTLLSEMQKVHVPCGEVKDLKAVFKVSEAQKMIREEKIENSDTKRVSSIAFQINKPKK